MNCCDSIFRNYYLTDGYAYTKDHIMVHKLYVYKIPLKTTVDDVRDYFGKYGTIKNVCFVTGKNRNCTNAAFVHFESPTTAARVLYLSSVRNIVLYKVQACDSWHQPNCQPTKEILRGKCIGVLPNRDGILVLNDDCLEIIIRLLPISSQLRFARSCSRICQVFQMTSKSLYRTLFVERLDSMTQWEIRDFFDFVGVYIKRIKGRILMYHCIMKFMSRFCINVEVLDLDMSIAYHPKNDLFLQLFHKLKKLRVLRLSENITLSATALKTLSPTIERLSVRNCIDIQYRHILSLSKSLRNLKELNLGENFFISNTIGKAMAVSMQNLETLTVCINRSDYGFVAKLPKLKNLTIFVSLRYNSCSSFFTQLVEHKSNQLESLSIDGGNCLSDEVAQQISCLKALRTLNCRHHPELTDRTLKYFCDLENLEEINLSGCTNITNTALQNLVRKCTKLKRVQLGYQWYRTKEIKL